MCFSGVMFNLTTFCMILISSSLLPSSSSSSSSTTSPLEWNWPDHYLFYFFAFSSVFVAPSQLSRIESLVPTWCWRWNWRWCMVCVPHMICTHLTDWFTRAIRFLFLIRPSEGLCDHCALWFCMRIYGLNVHGRFFFPFISYALCICWFCAPHPPWTKLNSIEPLIELRYNNTRNNKSWVLPSSMLLFRSWIQRTPKVQKVHVTNTEYIPERGWPKRKEQTKDWSVWGDIVPRPWIPDWNITRLFLLPWLAMALLIQSVSWVLPLWMAFSLPISEHVWERRMVMRLLGSTWWHRCRRKCDPVHRASVGPSAKFSCLLGQWSTDQGAGAGAATSSGSSKSSGS